MEGLFAVMSVVRVGQVHLFYRARLLSDQFDPGHETIEARLFTEDEIPWDEIAFRTVREALEHYFEDRRRGSFDRVHTVDIVMKSIPAHRLRIASSACLACACACHAEPRSARSTPPSS